MHGHRRWPALALCLLTVLALIPAAFRTRSSAAITAPAGQINTHAGPLPARALPAAVPGDDYWDPQYSGSLTDGRYFGHANYGESTLVVFRGELYAATVDPQAGGANPIDAIWRWNGRVWRPIRSILSSNAQIAQLIVFNDDLYATGAFSSLGGVPAANVARWDGSAWHALGAGINGPGMRLSVGADGLYIAGRFTMAGGVPAANIARWDGSAWTALGSGLGPVGNHLIWIRGLEIGPGGLYVGGDFQLA